MAKPSQNNPGIRVSAPYNPSDRMNPDAWAPLPLADYACHCGQTGTATGATEVKALVSEYLTHQSSHEDR